MTISLVKGNNINLSKDNPGLTEVVVGLGWDVNKYMGGDFDLDGSAALLNANGKLDSTSDFVFFNNLSNANNSVKHSGDNLTGKGDGDDEKIFVNLKDVPASVEKVAIAVTIYQGKQRNQNFGMVANAFIRVVDKATGTELARYDLGEDFSTETCVNFGELYRHNGDWKFKAIGQGIQGGVTELVALYQ